MEPGKAHFGEFQLLNVVGHGGMATVVRARSPEGSDLPPIVALKFLHPSLMTNKDAVNAFRHEGTLGMRIQNEAFCKVYGFEMRQGRLALVMEYVEGRSLASLYPYVFGTKLPSQQAASLLVAHVCRALEEIHSLPMQNSERKAVHRDVTPQNILLTERGEVKLIDFGVAFSPDRTLKTQAGLVKGKIAYLPPEYLRHEGWDERVDIWSAGVVLWELLARQRLFQRASMPRTVEAVWEDPIPPPSQLSPSVLAELDGVVLRMLKRPPGLRFARAVDAAERLEAISAEIDARPAKDVLARWFASIPEDHASGVMKRLPPPTGPIRPERPLPPVRKLVRGGS